MIDVQGSRVLITGGAGFIGSHIAEQLLSDNVGEIVILDNFVRGRRENLADAIRSGHVRLVEGDIRDRELLNQLLDGVDYCFHMAALRINQCAAEPRQALEVMFDGTFNVAEACAAHQIKKVVAASSASIYGTANRFPTPEDQHPYNNRTLYGTGKLAAEGIFRAFHDTHGLAYNMMRFFNVYGPRMDAYGKYTEVLIKWYRAIRTGKRPLIYGDGTQTMDFVYVDDVARANLLALKASTSDEAYNIACGIETSLVGLCQSLLAAMKSPMEPEFVPIPPERQVVEVSRRLADVSKARLQLGFTAACPLKDGLERLVRWLDSLPEIPSS
jgi:UDP-glucose 4-epimerase